MVRESRGFLDPVWSDSSRPVQLSAVRGSRFGCDCANVPGLAKPDTSWWLTAVSRAYLVAELLELLPLCRSDLPVDRIDLFVLF